MVKGKEEEALLNLEEKEDQDVPKFSIPKNMSQITVNIGPIKLQDLHAQELHQMFKASHAFSITFEKKDLDSAKKEHVGYVRLPFEFKTSTYLICVYNKLKNLRISGRDMSVNFPQEFVKLVEAAKKHQDESRKKLMAKKDIVQAEEEAKKKSVYVNNIPPNTSEDALKTLFPDSANVIIPKNSEGTSYGLAILEFDSADAAMMCIETSDEMELNGYKLKFSLAVSNKTESPKKISNESKDTQPSGNKESRKSTDDKSTKGDSRLSTKGDSRLSTKDDSRLKNSQSVRSSTSSIPSRRDSSTHQKSPAIRSDTKSRYSDTQKSSKSTHSSHQGRKGVTTASSATTTTTTSTSWAGKKELLPKSSTTNNQRAVGGRALGSNVGSRRMQQPSSARVMKTRVTTPQTVAPYGAGRGSSGRAVPTLSNRKSVTSSADGVMINRMVSPNNSMMSRGGATIASAAGMMSQPHGMMTSQGQGMVSMAGIRMVSPGGMMQPSNQMIIPVGPGTSQSGGMMPQMLTGGSGAVPSLIARTQQIMANTPAIGGRVFPGDPQTALRDAERPDHPVRVGHRDDWQRSPERRDDRSRHSSHERQRAAVLREDRCSPDRAQRSSFHGNDRDRYNQERLADESHYGRENWKGSGKSRGTVRPRYDRSPERDQGLILEKSHRSEAELAELKSQVEIIEETLNRVTGRGPFSPVFDDPHRFDGARPNISDRSPDLIDRGPILLDNHADFRERGRQELHDRFDERLSDISLPEYESVNMKRRHSFNEGRHEFDRTRQGFSPNLERDRFDDRDRVNERKRLTDWRDYHQVDFPESQRDMIAGQLPHEMDLRYPLDPQVEFGPTVEKRPYYGMEMEREPPKRHEGDMGFGGMNNPHFDERDGARFGRDEGLQSPREDRPLQGGMPYNRRGGKRGQGRGGRGRGH
ncbi:hypothetical protein ACJMK2_034179 [Sinanodonta woodiana]|uniref:RRM domain-containing protein n=1 Tax=Sinanodonta woodiana TaxID=1069815 RepID=A0ABD3WQR7_SINWO